MHYWSSDKLCLTQSASFFHWFFESEENQSIPSSFFIRSLTFLLNSQVHRSAFVNLRYYELFFFILCCLEKNETVTRWNRAKCDRENRWRNVTPFPRRKSYTAPPTTPPPPKKMVCYIFGFTFLVLYLGGIFFIFFIESGFC